MISNLGVNPMKLQAKLSLAKRLNTLLIGGCLLLTAASAVADIGTVTWQKQYTPTSRYKQGTFKAAGFNADGSVLACGFRSEADSGTAIGIRYNADTGAVLDTPPEWFLFEYSYSDYTHDRFYDQYIDSNGDFYFVGIGYRDSYNSFSSRYNVPNIWKYDSTYNNPASSNPDRPLWRNYYVTNGAATDISGNFESMAVDSTGNIYAVGYYSQIASNRNWIIDKYDGDGNRAPGFPLFYDRDGLHDYAYDVATDSKDNFIVVGYALVDADTNHYNWVVRKYESDGTLLWETDYDHANGSDLAFSVVVDSNDNIIVAGYRKNSSPESDNDWYIVKYAKDGDGNGGATIIWQQSWDDGTSRHGVAYGLLLDDADNFYVIGSQFKTSDSPAYTDRYRAILQYRDGQTGTVLASQGFVLDPTPNNRPDVEHDYLRDLALKGDQLVISGLTQQDDPTYLLDRSKTGRIVMLKLFPEFLNMMFRDGFE